MGSIRGLDAPARPARGHVAEGDAIGAVNDVERVSDGATSLLLLVPMVIEAAALRWAVPRATVLRTGVGPARAAAAAARASRLAGAAVAVGGFCGGLTDDLRPGDIVVASEVRGPSGQPVMCSSEALVATLRARAARAGRAGRGLPRVFVGPVVSVDHVVRGAERAALAADGALVVDMESAWLAPAAAGRPFAVLRVVLDTPAREVTRPLAMLIAGITAWRVLRRAGPALGAWAAVAGGEK